jgi:hypothetical protein
MHLDPIGQVFAAYDPDFEGTAPAAEVLVHAELQGSYADAAELLQAVAGSRAFAECFARHWLSFFLEQPLDSVEAGWIGSLADAVEAGASLTSVVEHTVGELYARSQTVVPWCEGE